MRDLIYAFTSYSGRSRGGARPPPPYFQTKLRPEMSKKILATLPPPHLSEGLDPPLSYTRYSVPLSEMILRNSINFKLSIFKVYLLRDAKLLMRDSIYELYINTDECTSF